MSLPSFSVRKPVTIWMITLIVILFGVVSLTKLPVELYPNTAFGEISIIIHARGGIPPTEVEEQITKLVEGAVSTVSNLQQVLSISKEGEATVVLSFQSGTDMNFAALEVREKFSKIKNKLPKEIEKPIIAQFKQGDVPILIVSATSEVRSTEDIRKIVDDTMKEAIRRVPGVANVEVAGGRERKIIVDVDQVKLASYGIPIDEVTTQLGANNLNLLSGDIEKKTSRYLVRVIGEYETVENIKNVALRRAPTGSVIRVKDVASVKDSYLEPKEYARLNVKPVVTVYIQKEGTKNTITVAQDLLDQIEFLKTKLPRDIHLVVTSNQAEFIKKAINNLQGALLKGIMLIILVFCLFLFKPEKKVVISVLIMIVAVLFLNGAILYAFLAGLVGLLVFHPKFRPIVIVTLPIPISVIGTFIFMRSSGLTINVMTLFGLTLGVGMLVDNSIVVFENILKKREAGRNILDAAVEGSQEMFLAIVASTMTTVIVFLPLVFMGEELQQLYSGMASTIVTALLMSMLCAVTLVPMLCARPKIAEHMVTHESDSKDSLFNRFASYQRKFLFRSIRHRGKVLLAGAGIFALSLFIFSQMGVEYLGSTEQNKFTIFVEMPTGAKLEASNKAVKKVEQIVEGIPEVENVSSRIEAWSSKVYVELKAPGKRKRNTADIIDSIRKQTDKIRPAFVYFQEEEQVGTKEVVLEIFGYSYSKLREIAIAIANQLERIEGLSDTKIRMREGRPEMQVLIDKKRAAMSDLTVSETANQIHGQMRGLRATVFHTEGKEVETISRLDEKYRKTFKDLYQLIMTSQDGKPILLDQISDFKFGLGPSEVWRKNKNRMIQVSSNIGKVPLSNVVEQIQESLKLVPFPEDYFYKVGGDYPRLQRTNKQMRLMILFVLVLVYLVLASLFESLHQPIIIMMAVPLSLIGAIAALALPGIGPGTIGVGALLGMMMLGGIVVNNSIMLLDRVNSYTQKKYSAVKAAVLATRDRLRPILMTVSTTTLGLIPMAVDRSEGANLWSPLALTVIGGILSSTVLTLLVTPAIYILSENVILFLRRLLRRLFRRFAQVEQAEA